MRNERLKILPPVAFSLLMIFGSVLPVVNVAWTPQYQTFLSVPRPDAICTSPMPVCGSGGGGDPHSPSNPCWAPYQNKFWSGYEFALGCGTSLVKAWSSWTIPTVSTPPTGCSTFCGLAIWAGLEDSLNAADNFLVQAGTLAQWKCGLFTCSYAYSAVYQFGATNSSQSCPMSVKPGDSIMTDITMSTGNSFAVVINDQTTNTACQHSQIYNMTPFFGAFIAERPLNCIQNTCGSDDLPQFNQFTINCEIDGASTSQPCYSGYNAGSFREDLMVNGGTQNIGLGSVASSNSFTETWWTSVNT